MRAPMTAAAGIAGSRGVRWALPALVALGLIAHYLDAIWSGNSDIAHHYALIARLAEIWQRAPGLDPSLGEMNFYPPLSHMMAAVAGGLFGSSILGMQVVTLCAIVALWGALAWLMQSLPSRMALPQAALAVVLLLINRRYFHIAMHGDEVVESFFYAQLVAQAMAALVMCLCVHLEQKQSPAWLRYAVLIAGIAVINYAHLLPGLELLGLLWMLIALDAAPLLRTRARVRGHAAYLALLAALALIAAACVFFHPTYAGMHEIAMHEGALGFVHLPTNAALIWLCAAMLLASTLLLWRWLAWRDDVRRRCAAVKYLAVYGLALALLCLLQLLAFRLGYGTLYAAKKYVFALDTVLLIDMALLPLLLLPQTWLIARPGAPASLHRIWLPALTLGLCVWAVLPAAGTISTARLVTLEREIGLLRDTVLQKTPGKFSYVVGLADQRGGINYLFSLGLLKPPRTANAFSILGGRRFSDPGQVGALITSENAKDYDVPACRRHVTPDSLVVLDGACVMAAIAQDFSCLRKFDFTDGGDLDPAMVTGFSAAENHGRWTDSPQAAFTCHATRAEAKPAQLLIEASAFLPGTHTQRLQVRINGKPAGDYVFSAAHASESIRLPLTDVAAGALRIDLIAPDAVSPQQLGLSGDTRRLGIGVRSIEFK